MKKFIGTLLQLTGVAAIAYGAYNLGGNEGLAHPKELMTLSNPLSVALTVAGTLAFYKGLEKLLTAKPKVKELPADQPAQPAARQHDIHLGEPLFQE
ncbi:MAG: hypothetical protein EOO16_14945 [Chitinophagaceae bacterium]|nr:MAG: hypothetical protein EOO16_14945 [Chitinophagaceae bacterium]